MKPTIIEVNADNINHESLREELFGPVFTMYKFKSDSEAIELANNTE